MAKAGAAEKRKKAILEGLEDALGKAVKTVFGTIVFMKVDAVESEPPMIEGDRISGWVAFWGDPPGMLMVHVGAERAARIAASVLGLPEDTPPRPEAVREAVGEVCSLIADNVKLTLGAAGQPVMTSIPTVVHGTDFGVSAGTRADRLQLSFRSESDPLLIEYYVWNGSARNGRST